MEEVDKSEVKKNVAITGTSTRYQMKKVLGLVKKEEKVKSEVWEVPEEYYTYEKQLELLYGATKYSDMEKYILNELSKKISGYKQQDQKNRKKTDSSSTKIKRQQDSNIDMDMDTNIDIDMDTNRNRNLMNSFVTLEYCFEQLKKQMLLCCYCKCQMLYLYTIQREPRQWTLDRVDNDGEHTCDNVVFCCLGCNLKRRCKSKDGFEFTKQLTVIRK
jgi:hypothetical protein